MQFEPSYPCHAAPGALLGTCVRVSSVRRHAAFCQARSVRGIERELDLSPSISRLSSAKSPACGAVEVGSRGVDEYERERARSSKGRDARACPPAGHHASTPHLDSEREGERGPVELGRKG